MKKKKGIIIEYSYSNKYGYIDLELDGLTFEEVKIKIDKKVKQFIDKNSELNLPELRHISLSFDTSENYTSIYLKGTRDETNDEYKLRLEREKQNSKTREENEKKEFIRLKEKYGSI